MRCSSELKEIRSDYKKFYSEIIFEISDFGKS